MTTTILGHKCWLKEVQNFQNKTIYMAACTTLGMYGEYVYTTGYHDTAEAAMHRLYLDIAHGIVGRPA